MDIKRAIKPYLEALEEGNYEKITKLFTDDATILSPLYGKIKAKDFYRKLFKDTAKSKITLLNVFRGDDKSVGAGHFCYDWTLKGGTSTSFECVDVFRFAADGKIKQLTIIYDAHKTRRSLGDDFIKPKVQREKTC